MTAPVPVAEPYPHATAEQVDGWWTLTIAHGPADQDVSLLPSTWTEALATSLATAVTAKMRQALTP